MRLKEKDHGTPAPAGPARDTALPAVSLTIDGQSVTVPEGTSVMRAASLAGIEIPKLCATDTLKSFGSCRLCLVEIDGRRGKQAMSLVVKAAAPSVVKGNRKPADDMAVIVEDLIKLLDSVSNQLRRGKYPPDEHARKTAAVLRAVADDLDI